MGQQIRIQFPTSRQVWFPRLPDGVLFLRAVRQRYSMFEKHCLMFAVVFDWFYVRREPERLVRRVRLFAVLFAVLFDLSSVVFDVRFDCVVFAVVLFYN